MSPDQRPPSSSRVSGWRPDTGPTLDRAATELTRCDVTVEGRMPWSSNLTFLVTLDSDTTSGLLQAVYKPHQGERALWDFHDGLYRREAAASVLSDLLGWGIVPPTVVRQDLPFGPGSLQLFMEADYEQHYFTVLEGGGRVEELQMLCAFDIVANNADRKAGHVLVGPDGSLWGIDQGLCFHVQHKLRTVVWDFVGERIPEWVSSDLEGFLAGGSPAALEGLLSAAEIDRMLWRTERLLAAGVFPEPSEDHPPYPWPMI